MLLKNIIIHIALHYYCFFMSALNDANSCFSLCIDAVERAIIVSWGFEKSRTMLDGLAYMCWRLMEGAGES